MDFHWISFPFNKILQINAEVGLNEFRNYMWNWHKLEKDPAIAIWGIPFQKLQGWHVWMLPQKQGLPINGKLICKVRSESPFSLMRTFFPAHTTLQPWTPLWGWDLIWIICQANHSDQIPASQSSSGLARWCDEDTIVEAGIEGRMAVASFSHCPASQPCRAGGILVTSALRAGLVWQAPFILWALPPCRMPTHLLRTPANHAMPLFWSNNALADTEIWTGQSRCDAVFALNMHVLNVNISLCVSG